MCQRVRDGRQPAECAMWSAVVVAMLPVFGHSADLAEILEDVTVEDFGPEGPVEPLNLGILSWLAKLDVDERDPVSGCPVLQGLADELRPIVETQALRLAECFDQFVERADDAAGRQAGVDLDPQRFAVEVVVDVEGPEPPAGPQGIRHEVCRPCVIGSQRDRQWRLDAVG